MKWKEWFQTASVRQYAMIGAAFILTGLLVWGTHEMLTFLEGKSFTPDQFYQLTKMQLQALSWQNYSMAFGIILIVVALTLTKFSAVTKLGSVNVGGEEEQQPKQVVVTTTVEKKDGNAPGG